MKKLINKSIILSLFLALTACNDWLNVSPKTDMKAEDLFSTEAGFRDALIGVYALMATDNLYGKNLSIWMFWPSIIQVLIVIHLQDTSII